MAIGAITVLEVTAGDGPLRMDLLQFAGDGAYPTGGTPNFQAAVRAALGKGQIELIGVIGQVCGGLHPYYDKAADKLLVYSGAAEVSGASNQSAVQFRLIAISK